MNIILLSGGSGKRLWPLSNDVRSKQFLKLLADEEGRPQSMIQRVYGQLKQAQPGAGILVATGASQEENIRGQLEGAVDIVCEPERRDTFPAILLACAYLALEKGVGEGEPVLVLPVDPYTEPDYFRILSAMEAAVAADLADMVLMGIRPKLPTSKYGYILPGPALGDGVRAVSRFVEKPDEATAEGLVGQGAFWNGGVFAFRLGYLMDIARRQIPVTSFAELRARYGELEKISFDYAVVEKARRVAMVEFDGLWTDVGTWRTLTDEMATRTLGNVLMEGCEGSYAVNELNIPLLALGLKDVVVAAGPDGILVSDLAGSSHMKPLVDKLEDTRPMYEERRWGEYTVVEKSTYRGGKCSLVKHLTLKAGKSVSYQLHRRRDEVWTVASGEADFALDGERQKLKTGDVVRILRGQRHSVRAITDIHIIEVQLGEALTEDDIEKFDWNW